MGCAAAYAFALHQCGTLTHPAAHYHIKGPLLWRLAGKASTKPLFYRQGRRNCPMSGGPRHNCRGPPRSCWSWCIKPRTASVRGRQKPHPQVGVTSGCEPSWPHAVQVDTRPGGFCYLTARLPMICMVVVPFSPTIHQSHREAFQHLVELWRSAYHADRHHPGCIDVPAPAWDKPPEPSTVRHAGWFQEDGRAAL
ncbi:hypothetical protein F5883DRAFT_218803 [Diaporthe sp. PMI_573]|nr:hypothetical protein F5883DRAFT_218803 [Diaporthaceae sp. PMI_573]